MRLRKLWLVFLTGIPFAIYKFGFGWYIYHHEYENLGIVAMIWGVVDFSLNLLSLFFPRWIKHCLLSNVGSRFDAGASDRDDRHWESVFLGLDTLAAFAIVSGMIWFGALPLSPKGMEVTWNVAVVANLLGAGLQQVWGAVVHRTGLGD